MAFTSHGHHITGSPDDGDIPRNRARCGGSGLCTECSLEVQQYHNDQVKKKVEVTQELRTVAEPIEYEPVNAEALHGEPTLQDELANVLNRYSAENGSGTPDFILAEFLMGCLESYNKTIARRAQWHGKVVDSYGNEENPPEVGTLMDDISEEEAAVKYGRATD